MPRELPARITEFNDGYWIDGAIKRRASQYRQLGWEDQEADDQAKVDFAPVECAFFTALCVQRFDLVKVIQEELLHFIKFGLGRKVG